MRKRNLMGVGMVAMGLSLSACGNKTKPVETVAETVVETTVAEKDFSMDLETIATTEVSIEEKVVNVGIYETEAGGGYNGVTADGEAIVQLNTIELSSGYKFTEEESLYLDAMISGWIADETLQRPFLTERMEDRDFFVSLSDTDRVEVVDKIVEKYPHAKPVTKPVETKPASKPKESKPSSKPKETQASTPKETAAPKETATPDYSSNTGDAEWDRITEENNRKMAEEQANGASSNSFNSSGGVNGPKVDEKDVQDFAENCPIFSN
ncbi:MAG: hypothetical protein RR446_03235 [Lachnospiraceae bacterium]